ncbi:MAG: helix-turn-helix transcriptional regulator, partial [Clostridia bacterium]|nr:helix-turn-helix transcriptional regulator [Clostridia bacterium]
IHSNHVSFLINNRLYHVPAGSAIISRPNDIHMCIFDRKEYYSFSCLWIDGDFDAPAFAFLRDCAAQPQLFFSEAEADAVQECFAQLQRQKENPLPSALEQTAVLFRMLSLMEKADRQVRVNPALPQKLQDILNDISQNYTDIRSLGDLLDRHYISQSTLNRYFRRYLHTSAYQYLLSRKLAYAAQLLSDGAAVTEACIRAGFTDVSRFIVQFKREFSVTPGQYRDSTA